MTENPVFTKTSAELKRAFAVLSEPDEDTSYVLLNQVRGKLMLQIAQYYARMQSTDVNHLHEMVVSRLNPRKV
jgi:DNA-binding protein Fis